MEIPIYFPTKEVTEKYVAEGYNYLMVSKKDNSRMWVFGASVADLKAAATVFGHTDVIIMKVEHLG